jgi:hypothetical protein
MRPALTLWLLLALATGGAAQRCSADPDSVRIITSDIDNFWRAYDVLTRHSTHEDSVRAFAEQYFKPASPGLAEFIRLRIGSPDSLVDALGKLPRYYAAIRSNTIRIHQLTPLIRDGLRRFQTLYPEAVFPDVYFLIGRFSSKGTLSDSGLFIGAEMVSSDASTPTDELPGWARAVTLRAEVIPCTVVHELVHYQQHNARSRTLLASVLNEGVPDFLTDHVVRCEATSVAYAYGDRHQRDLWVEFQQAKHGTDYSRWLHNGLTSTDRPANLGYWMGYQIAKAYHDRATDKRQAVYDLLHIRDYDALLEASGYAKRMER